MLGQIGTYYLSPHCPLLAHLLALHQRGAGSSIPNNRASHPFHFTSGKRRGDDLPESTILQVRNPLRESTSWDHKSSVNAVSVTFRNDAKKATASSHAHPANGTG